MRHSPTLTFSGNAYYRDIRTRTPLDRSLGTLSMEISCAAPAKGPFLRGLALQHSFAWPEARTQFQAAATADPACAMAYWGEAMSYYDGLHNPPSDADLAAAKQALAKAEQAMAKADHDRAYIAAANALFDRYATAAPSLSAAGIG